MVRVLTHSVHTAYEYLFRYLDWDVDQIFKLQEQQWYFEFRDCPQNVHLIPALDYDKAYDMILAQHHSVAYSDFRALADKYHAPMMLKLHTFANETAAEWLKKYLRPIVTVTNSFEVRDSWGLANDDLAVVARLPFDLDFYGGYTGEHARAIYVGNDLSTDGRDRKIKQLCDEGVPVELVGWGLGGLPGQTASWEGVRTKLQENRVFVNVRPFLTMSPLEAMATGCPVVSLRIKNYQQELSDNVPQAKSISQLVNLAKELIDDPTAAQKLGQTQRACIASYFTVRGFQEAWENAVTKLMEQ